MNTGKSGIITRVTISIMMFWNSYSAALMTSAFVHAADNPTSTEKTSALITGNIWGISSLNTSSGNSRKPSGLATMDK